MIDKYEIENFIRRVAATPDQKIDIGEVALAFAALEYPHKDIDFYRKHLETLSKEVEKTLSEKNIKGPNIEEKITVLNEVLFNNFDYKGDDKNYENLKNINLMDVIDRRKGLPITLGIIYLYLGQKQGWDVKGLNFPGHFLVKISDGPHAIIVDPFHYGKKLQAVDLRGLLKASVGLHAELKPEYYAVETVRSSLLRLQTNVKVRLISRGDFRRALKILDSMLWIAPDRSDLWYEAGFINAELGNFDKAIEMLEIALNHISSNTEREQVLVLLHQLRVATN